MRALTAAVLAASLAFAAGPAAAGPHWGPHWGGYHHYHGGFWGGPGLVLGLGAAALVAGVAAESCVRYQPVYDDFGNYMGRRAVNVC